MPYIPHPPSSSNVQIALHPPSISLNPTFITLYRYPRNRPLQPSFTTLPSQIPFTKRKPFIVLHSEVLAPQPQLYYAMEPSASHTISTTAPPEAQSPKTANLPHETRREDAHLSKYHRVAHDYSEMSDAEKKKFKELLRNPEEVFSLDRLEYMHEIYMNWLKVTCTMDGEPSFYDTDEIREKPPLIMGLFKMYSETALWMLKKSCFSVLYLMVADVVTEANNGDTATSKSSSGSSSNLVVDSTPAQSIRLEAVKDHNIEVSRYVEARNVLVTYEGGLDIAVLGRTEEERYVRCCFRIAGDNEDQEAATEAIKRYMATAQEVERRCQGQCRPILGCVTDGLNVSFCELDASRVYRDTRFRDAMQQLHSDNKDCPDSMTRVYYNLRRMIEKAGRDAGKPGPAPRRKSTGSQTDDSPLPSSSSSTVGKERSLSAPAYNIVERGRIAYPRLSSS
ncbi:uncharacterized protein BO97DRAFT_466114 [Aspergillus homomorphus CBS 101889]|uniref:Uncharacterized protein n=1 Tax=Aspergillus homomorphus (strain CBS 101889) TaxID=1450537 RepID=A0A395I5B9_ASPHC|nr:hypothetical protein BO97DRAFT_466114 [Aspergillus homomorphus CBS 101889]RAL14388.1 hypothetical protein BO97DRAFT_466114 [Aspergillus homomorphus CBS 101889]